MASYAYRFRESSLDRRQRGYLNPIIEEDCDDDCEDDFAGPAPTSQATERRLQASHLNVQAWLSPLSDHFPTPRGEHYLAAPIIPSSPSTSSADDSSPTTLSNTWARASVLTDVTEFEDLYDVTDEEEGQRNGKSTGLRRSTSVKRRGQTRRLSAATPQQLTPLIIPGRQNDLNQPRLSAVELKKKALQSPIPLTASSEIPMSPAQVEFMGRQQSLLVPGCSAPPSLDGSLTSEQLAAMSSPPTPVIGNDEDPAEEPWAGVRLQPGALATLLALSNENSEGALSEQSEPMLDNVSQASFPEMQQQGLELATDPLPPTNLGRAPSSRFSRQSLADLTRLDIPSPGGFFGGLSPRTRSTWHPHSLAANVESQAPPTSTTAEQFYRCPWNADESAGAPRQKPDPYEEFYRSAALSSDVPVEHIIEVCDDDDDVSDDQPTAKPTFQLQTPRAIVEDVKSPTNSDEGTVLTEIVTDCDPECAREQQLEALSHLDRTELWLLAQRAYLRGVDGADHALELTNLEEFSVEEPVEEVESEPEQAVIPRKKTVHFPEIITTNLQPLNLPPKSLRQESAYYRAFQEYVVRKQSCDVFVQQLSRFEALQAQRVSLRSAHKNQLLGKYQLSVVPQSAKKRLSANVARGDDTLIDDPLKLRKEKEGEAMNQMTMATWHVAAVKFLNGGKLINAPVTKRLTRLSRMTPGKDGLILDRARILDLGGQSTCDWAWHCALQYPNTKIYTVTTKAVRQFSNSNIRGPSNHRQVAVERLTKLPFADGQFDLVFARELHSLLKFYGENGEDEWETCLQECMRVLKPGGFLEFSLLDSDIMNAGPLGLAKSVEFGYSLKTLGYDPAPTKLWLGRLARAGFEDVRRAWLCLPLGAKPAPPSPPKHDSMVSEVKVCQMDAMTMGSTDNIANVCSIAAGWNWERWLLRCEMEKAAGELRLADTVTASPAMEEAGKCLEGVNAVMEEGRSCRAGFRMLNGYAMKPRTTELISVALVN